MNSRIVNSVICISESQKNPKGTRTLVCVSNMLKKQVAM